jgi:hypothetical protein
MPPNFVTHTKQIQLRSSPDLSTMLDIRLFRPYSFVVHAALILAILAALGHSLVPRHAASPVSHKAVLNVQAGSVHVLSPQGESVLHLTAGESALVEAGAHIVATEGHAHLIFYDGSQRSLAGIVYTVTDSTAPADATAPTRFNWLHFFFQSLEPEPRHYNNVASVLG